MLALSLVVALRKESVDRNRLPKKNRSSVGRSLSARRAWIEIRLADMSAAWNRLSLSARRAWIEISYGALAGASEIVALRKESVDRNKQCRNGQNIKRRVALRKESVDRNNIVSASFRACTSRSPQGERG